MTLAQHPYPPTDLLSDEPPLESSLHLKQILLLLSCLEWFWRERQDFFAAGNLSIYYDLDDPKLRRFRGPDFFVVLNTDRRERLSWMVWEEDNKYPNVIVEILSKKTAAIDRNQKKQLYQDTFKTPEYFWFHPRTLEFMGLSLEAGTYTEITATSQGWRWSQELELYLGVQDTKLRYFTPDGVMVPTFLEETARQEQVIAAAQLRAEQETLRADRLVARLRELGIDPDQ